MNAPGAVYHRLEDLLAHPELLEPPPVVLPRLAWAGRMTLLAAPEKAGKSTLVGQAVAAMAQGKEFLGEPTERGQTLWLALDEPLNDVVRRFVRYGTRDGVAICQEVVDPVSLKRMVQEVGATVVVIDTLSEFARGLVDDYNSAAQWTPMLNGLRSILQSTGAGGILLHHATKATGRYRDSSAIGAGVDVILEMGVPAEDPVVRLVRARGRVAISDFKLRFLDPWYQLDGDELPLDLRVYRVVQSRPGVSRNRVREAVYGSTRAIDATLADLCRRGAIENRSESNGHAYHVKLAENGNGRVPPRVPGGAEHPNSFESCEVPVESRSRVPVTGTPSL